MRGATILHLGVKELRSLLRDPMMIFLIIYIFSFGIYTMAKSVPDTLHKAPIAIVDEDRSQLSARIAGAFFPPLFMPPALITQKDMDARMDAGIDTFALVIPPDFQRDVLAGRSPTIQLNVDATRMSQAFAGSGYVQTIVGSEVNAFLQGYQSKTDSPVDLALRVRFNSELNKSWFSAVMELINNITILSIVLTGAALIREREHGTVEHLLVMPVTPVEIMLGKVWSMGLVVLAASAFALRFVVEGWLDIPLQGSKLLFTGGAALHLFAVTSMGIFFATVARSMPQLGLLTILTLMPLQILSGGTTPRESMPELVQNVMLVAPTTHFVELAQAILFRGADLNIVWPQLLALAAIGTTFFVGALSRLRKSLN